MLKVSIIVPVYNGEKYIEDLIVSLRKQTLSDIEILSVDDGSTDKTSEIIKKFITEDERIRYIYQKNQGGGVARNTGIENANAPYLICIDADDLYEENMAELLYNKAISTDADITISKFSRFDIDTGRISKGKGINKKALPSKEVFSSKDVYDILQVTTPGPCNKLYKLSFIKENNLKYSSTRIINDLKFGMLALVLAKKIAVCDKDLSIYRYKTAGSGTSRREKYINNSISVFDEIYREFVERGLFQEYKNTYFSKIFDTINYEISFPVSDEVISNIKNFLSKQPFAALTREEMTAFLNIAKMKKHVFEYGLLNCLTLFSSSSIRDKYSTSKIRIDNLKKLGIK